MEEPLSDQELTELEALTQAAAPAPWVPLSRTDWAETASSGWTGLDDQFPPDMYILRDDKIAPDADIEFIAAARNYMPQLLAEIRLRRSQSH